jgi:diguanylate cyclase (GGDEF)-like protein/PAS domain S-box-containing protein
MRRISLGQLYRWIAAIALIGMLLSGTAYYFSVQHEAQRLHAHFEHLAHESALRLQSALNEALMVLTAAQGLFGASQQINRNQFRLMVSPTLTQHPAIMAIHWAPRVQADERNAFKQALKTEALGDLGDLGDLGNLDILAVSSDARAEYLPILFSEPLANNRTALGTDFYAQPENRDAMHRAVQSGSKMSAQPFVLANDPVNPLAVAIYQPIFWLDQPHSTSAQRQTALRGFVILVLRLDTPLKGVLTKLSSEGIDIRLLDGGQSPALVQQLPSLLPNQKLHADEPLQSSYPLTLPGRELTLQMTATDGFYAQNESPEPTAVLFAGLTMSVLLLLLLGAHVRQCRQEASLLDELQTSESRFQQLTDNLDAVFWIISSDWRQVVYISPAYERIWGRSTEDIYRNSGEWFDAIIEEDRASFKQQIPGADQTDWNSFEFSPFRIRRPDGSLRWITSRAYPVRDSAGQLVRIAGIAEDISNRIAHQQLLEEQAHFDTLTHLPNRRLLSDRMQLALARCHRSHDLIGICMLDLDGFKPVNDRYGHEVGDQLLIEVAQRLRECVRGDDTVARLGGDEFVLLLGGLKNVKELEDVLRRVLQCLAAIFSVADKRVSISASIGVTLYPNDSGDADTLLRHADHAMYLAKEAGKNRYLLFNPVLEERERDNRIALGLIKKAIADNQLCLYYQPIVDCRRGRVVGMEALVRWQHPILGLMGPGAFLPLVESDDTLARDVGKWVMRKAIEQAVAWRRVGLNIPVSINVFVQQLRDMEFSDGLQALLAEYPELPPDQICIEILENTALDDFSSVIRLIQNCASKGIRFALDDFGTGFSSLTYLRRLPVNSLKIDQSFVRDMLQDPGDLTIVEGVISLSKAFRHQVVAEGVESAEHALMLMEMGCNLVQGYGIARPMSSADTEAWLKNFQPDPRWLENAAQRLSRDDFQLVLAEVNHRQWLASLQNWMHQDPEHRHPAPPLHSHECNFGRWYYGEGARRYGKLAEYQAAETLHESVHFLAQKLVHETESGATVSSRETEAVLLRTAGTFVDALGKIRNVVKYNDVGS